MGYNKENKLKYITLKLNPNVALKKKQSTIKSD